MLNSNRLTVTKNPATSLMQAWRNTNNHLEVANQQTPTLGVQWNPFVAATPTATGTSISQGDNGSVPLVGAQISRGHFVEVSPAPQIGPIIPLPTNIVDAVAGPNGWIMATTATGAAALKASNPSVTQALSIASPTSIVMGSSPATLQIEAFATTATQVLHSVLSGATWGAFLPLPQIPAGTVTAIATARNAANFLDVVALCSSAVFHSIQTAPGIFGPWNKVFDVNGGTSITMTRVLGNPGVELVVFVADGSPIIHTAQQTGVGSPTWGTVAPLPTAPPAIGRFDMVAVLPLSSGTLVDVVAMNSVTAHTAHSLRGPSGFDNWVPM